MPGEGRRGWVAEVALRRRTYSLRAYAIDESQRELARPGALVRVPVGRRDRLADGWIARVSEQDWDQTRPPLASIAPANWPLSDALVELALWLADYYHAPPGKVFQTILPAYARPRRITFVRACAPHPENPVRPRDQAILAELSAGPLARKALLARAVDKPETLRRLVRAGLVELFTLDEPPLTAQEAPADLAPAHEDDFALTAGQQAAVDAIDASLETPAFSVSLLFGIPGSGKTEVYVRAIRRAIQLGRQAILLVPEIALTTQVTQRLARRFGRVAVLHSRLSASARREALRRISAGAVDVIIGTRTAVFAPCSRLGLLVVDEEQEHSYKSLGTPFYHARDVAIKRGQLERIPVILGSATPSLETWRNVQTLAHFRTLRLPERAPGATLPRVEIVDTSTRGLGERAGVLSSELLARLRETLAAGRQAILLHNRRGYAASVRCERCGLQVVCERCGARLVFHRATGQVRCHRCGLRATAPAQCLDSTCGGPLKLTGMAIQRLEEELLREIPTARLLRLDRDRVRKLADYESALTRFEQQQADVLLGTQMVAKGLDFPNVGLVGVIDADAALRAPDFRAAETFFQLVAQVVGRAGRRDADSLAVIQSADARHPVLLEAAEMRYERFASNELALRAELRLPPVVRLARFVCADPSRTRAREAADGLVKRLREIAGRLHAGLLVDDAGECVIPRVRELFRYEALVRAPQPGLVQKLLNSAESAKALRVPAQRLTLDVDPVDLL